MRTGDKSVVENTARSAGGISVNLRIKQLSGNTFRTKILIPESAVVEDSEQVPPPLHLSSLLYHALT